ncbi:MAG: DUF1439 domain-containing protein [Algicola sp.]|nr:DUF1439 domain-containing protein [Algicola sp.]
MTLYKKVQNWAARSLIRSKRIKEVRYNAQQLNEMVVQSLPHQEAFEVPGGQATLVVMEANVSVGNDNTEGLAIKVMCSLEISSLGRQLYRAHIDGLLKAVPYFNQAHKTVRLKDLVLSNMTFVNDEYLLIQSSQDIVKSFTPSILKGIVDVTIGSALNVMSGVATPAVKEYLNVFVDANKQKVLDFHQPQIDSILTAQIENGALEYKLKESDFEEKIFSDLGQKIDVDNHELVFKF